MTDSNFLTYEYDTSFIQHTDDWSNNEAIINMRNTGNQVSM